MAAAAAVIGTVDGDADALMTCKQTTSGTGILRPDQNIYAVTVQRQPALQETWEQNSLCVPVFGVSWRPLANVSQADCAAQFKSVISQPQQYWHLLQLQ